MMNTKALRAPLSLKADGEPGQVTAVFSTFDVVDSDNDIVLTTALTHGQQVPMTDYGHDWTQPVGKGVILVQEKQAVFDGRFFLETDAGLESYKTVKAMGTLQEWSWGFSVVDAAYEQRDTQFVRLIKRAQVYEVSPVLVGAGMGTYTLGIKGFEHSALADQVDTVLAAVADLASRYKALAALRAKEGRVLSEANRKRLSSLLESLRAVETDIDELLTSTVAPEKSVDVGRLFLEFQRIKAQLVGA
jgi:HK97 family phage prohead protease